MYLKYHTDRLFGILIVCAFIIKGFSAYNYSCDTNAICGCSSSSVLVNRIVGGETASLRSWSWSVSIRINGGLCGGSILSAQWIITAAHCVAGVNATAIRVFAGSNTVFSGQARAVSNIYTHPQYNPSTFANDIALLRLSTRLNMSDPNVKPTCIPNVNTTTLNADGWPGPNRYLVAVGWGRLAESGTLPTALQQVTVQSLVSNHSICSPLVSTANRPLQLCAGYVEGGKDTCQGDSGGPLMMYTTSRQWVLVGLTSFGNGCARPNEPGVYTRVAYYRNWISSITNNSYATPSSSISANINPFLITSNTTTMRPISSTTTRRTNATTMRTVSTTTIRRTNATTIRPVSTTTIRRTNTTTMRPVSSTTIRRTNATTMRPVSTTTTRRTNATTIRLTNTTTIRPTNVTIPVTVRCVLANVSHRIPTWILRRRANN